PGRRRFPRPQLCRRARGPSEARGLLLDRHPGAQRLRRARGGDAVYPRKAQVLRPDHRRAPVLARGGQDPLRQRLRALAAQVASRDVRGLQVPGGRGVRRLRRDHAGHQAQGPRAERRRPLRHRGPGGDAGRHRRPRHGPRGLRAGLPGL
ncbi:MAG: Predicted amidohydrolase SSO1643, partial [uncultured Rubrobacteraceae bacterium]